MFFYYIIAIVNKNNLNDSKKQIMEVIHGFEMI